MQALDWAYEKSINGVAGLDSAEELAKSYMQDSSDKYEQANSLLIRWQNTKSATSGFITGLGGIMTLPVAIPANITSVLYVQVRMIAVHHIGGYDIRDDRVKTLVYACLVANSAKDLAKDVGIAVGNKVAINAIKSISGKTLQEIKQEGWLQIIYKF